VTDEPQDTDDEETLFPALLRRIVGPAAAIVVLYASIRALPPLLMNRVPPIDGGDLLAVFVVSLLFFSLLSLYFKHRAKRESPEE